MNRSTSDSAGSGHCTADSHRVLREVRSDKAAGHVE